MNNIRKSVFETNSSSTHSISFSYGDYIPRQLYVDPEGICTIYPDEFGWEIEEYKSSASKASYCMAYAFNLSRDDYKRDEHIKMLEEVIKEVTGCKEVRFSNNNNDSKFYDYGYIDHQSADVAREAFESKEKLKNFIFNPNTILRTDNDNY